MKVKILFFVMFFSFACHAACEQSAIQETRFDDFAIHRGLSAAKTLKVSYEALSPYVALVTEDGIKNFLRSDLNRFCYFDKTGDHDICSVPSDLLLKALKIPFCPEILAPKKRYDWNVLFLAGRLGIKDKRLARQIAHISHQAFQSHSYHECSYPCGLCGYMIQCGYPLLHEETKEQLQDYVSLRSNHQTLCILAVTKQRIQEMYPLV